MRSVILWFLFGFISLSSTTVISADTTPPEIRSIEFSTDSVDVSDGAKSITISLTAYDAESAIRYAYIYLNPPAGIPDSHRKYVDFQSNDWSLTTQSNIYTATKTINLGKNVAKGNWSVEISNLDDFFGNSIPNNILTTDLDALGIESSLEVLNTNEIDITPPSLVNVEFSIDDVDLTNGDKAITITLTAQDESSAVTSASLYLYPPEGIPSNHRKYLFFERDIWIKNEQSGYYSATKALTFNQLNSARGAWAATIYDLNDENQNRTEYQGRINAQALVNMGINPYVEITNPNNIDITPPKFSGLEFSTNHIDTTNGSQTINVMLQVTDENKPNYAYIDLIDPNGDNQTIYFHEGDWYSGDEDNSYFATSSFTFTSEHLSGVWNTKVSYLRDVIGNTEYNSIQAKDIERMDFDPYLRVNVTDEEVLDLSLSAQGSQEVLLGEVVNNLFTMQGTKLDTVKGVLKFGFTLSTGVSFASISVIGADIISDGCKVLIESKYCLATSNDWSLVSFSLDTRVNGLGEHIVTGSIDTHESYNYDTNRSESDIELNHSNNEVVRTLTTLNYPATPTDFDGDGIANDMDLDDDADGIPDEVEAELGLNSLDHYDGGLDLDGDGVSNSAEYLAGTDLNAADDSPKLSGRYASFEEYEGMPFVISSNYQLENIGTIDGTGVLVKSFTVDNNSALTIKAVGEMKTGTLGFASKMDKAISFVIHINGESVEYETKTPLGDDWYYYSLEVESGFSDVMLTFSGEVSEGEAKVYVDSVFMSMVKPLVAGDYDGDGKAEITMRNPLNYQNYWKELSEGDFNEQEFGRLKDDIPINGDFDGDGKADWAIRRRSDQTWYVKHSSDGETISKHFGKQAGDIPVAADYDGDGITDFAIRRPSNNTWYILQSSDGKLIQKRFGLQRTDVPVPADYDGDGKADIAIRRPSNGTWYVLGSLNNKVEITRFGVQANDIPVPADYDGDGKDDIAVRRASDRTWYILQSSDQQIRKIRFGVQAEDIPVVSDYDGDGKADIAVRRPSSFMWYILMSSTNEIHAEEFGRSSVLVPNLAPLYTRLSMTRNVSATTQSQDYVPIEDGHEERLQYQNSSTTSSPEFKGKETLEAVVGF